MKIAALARASGTSRSTIHHYRNLGLLPPPERRGPKLHVYGPVQLAVLRDIARWRAEGRTLDEIRERLRRRKRTELPTSTAPRTDDPVRARVLAAAAPLFLERGFDGVEIADILRASGTPRVTFYRHFRGKPDCFLGCVDELRYALATATERAQLGHGGDFLVEAGRRISAVLARARGWIDLNRLLLQTEAGADPLLAARAREGLHRMVTNAEPAIRRGQRAGKVRAGDTELLAYMSWGATLFAAYWLELRAPRAVEEASSTARDFVGAALEAKGANDDQLRKRR